MENNRKKVRNAFSIMVGEEPIQVRELLHAPDIDISAYEFMNTDAVLTLGIVPSQKAMQLNDKKTKKAFGLSATKFLDRVEKIVAAIEKEGRLLNRLHSATLDRGINLKAKHWNEWSPVIKEAERAYESYILNFTKYFSMETHKELEEAIILPTTQWFRKNPYDGEKGRDDKRIGGAGNDYVALRRRVLSLSSRKAVNELFKVQKSENPVQRGHFNYIVSDLNDILYDRRYWRGAELVLDKMRQEGIIPDKKSYHFNCFLHRPLQYAAYIIPVLHPIRHFILFSELFFSNTQNYLLSPNNSECFVKFIVTIKSIGHTYRNRVSIERDVDKERKKNKDIRFSTFGENMQSDPDEKNTPYDRIDRLDNLSAEECPIPNPASECDFGASFQECDIVTKNSDSDAGEGRQRLDEFRKRNIVRDNWLILMLGGVVKEDGEVAVAAGIEADGNATILDIEPGGIESTEIAIRLLTNLSHRGFSPMPGYRLLVCFDGSQALRTAVESVFPNSVFQCCLEHKESDISKCLSSEKRIELPVYFDRIRKSEGEDAGRKALRELDDFLSEYNTDAHAILRESGDDLIRLHILNTPATLNQSLMTTNLLKNLLPRLRHESDQNYRLHNYKDLASLREALRCPPD